MKELKNSKYLISGDINRSMLLAACVRIILIQGDKMKELKNSKYLISGDINRSVFSL